MDRNKNKKLRRWQLRRLEQQSYKPQQQSCKPASLLELIKEIKEITKRI